MESTYLPTFDLLIEFVLLYVIIFSTELIRQTAVRLKPPFDISDRDLFAFRNIDPLSQVRFQCILYALYVLVQSINILLTSY